MIAGKHIQICICLIFFLSISLPSFAKTFYIEDPALSALPKAVEDAIFAQERTYNMDSCAVVGRKIQLSDESLRSDYVATATGSCRGQIGPIWLVRYNGRNYQVILESGGYSLELAQEKNNGLYNVTISGGSASHMEIKFWSFTGTRYEKTESYHFDAYDLKTCKEHPIICPFVMNDKLDNNAK